MIGLPMSSLATPDARIRARAPAMLRPWVTVRDLSWGIVARSFDRKDCLREYASGAKIWTECP
ncbi:hypothetical protein GCM10010327_69030 [Streptomyces nitrosporeus]|nr:hypothetical protein GCM10010327_69030 [Streptomyces nitrosporeus]